MKNIILMAFAVPFLSGCLGTGLFVKSKPVSTSVVATAPDATRAVPAPVEGRNVVAPQGQEVVMYAMSLLDIDYRFGGKNPERGLDCSGMVSYIYENAVGVRLPHNAAKIAQMGRTVDSNRLRPGDLVFFNTQNRAFSHVGIYIGDDRFVHAPSTNGKIKVSRLSESYFAKRFEVAITLLD